jgi:predicted SAM-dependent methyltransferase
MEAAPVETSAGAILHVGCGGDPLPDWLKGEETRLDIDPRHKPDIIASMTELGDIGEFDFIYCSHALEHLHHHEVKLALREFHRVLKSGGGALIVVPNLENVRPTFDVVYTTAGGWEITGFHMFYGAPEMIEDNPHMAHRSGFVPETMTVALKVAGFQRVKIVPDQRHNLIAAARK